MVKAEFDEETIHCIYGLFSPEGNLRYIGYSSNVENRIYEHHFWGNLKGYTRKENWIKYLLNNGKTAELVILKRFTTAEELNDSEIETIAYYRKLGYDLTNANGGGKGGQLGVKHSEETRNKISQSNKGRKLSEQSKKNISEGHKGIPVWNKGIPTPLEVRKKISESGKGRIVSEETRKKFSISNKGRVVSEETKEKLRLANIGKPSPMKGKHHSEETKLKLSIAQTGKKMPPRTEEYKLKISIASSGRKHSEETKMKMRGRKVSEEAKLKMSLAKRGKPSPNKGKTITEEQKLKLLLANLGKKHSEETRKKISDNQKKFSPNVENSMIEDYKLGLKTKVICEKYGAAVGTLYRILPKEFMRTKKIVK